MNCDRRLGFDDWQVGNLDSDSSQDSPHHYGTHTDDNMANLDTL